jgi:sensor histidine kinase YesM
MLISATDAAWTVLLDSWLHPIGPHFGLGVLNSMLGFFYSKLHLDAMAYLGILALVRLVESGQILAESRLALAEREEQLAKARLEALRRQLQPHFLFNALNGIAGLVRSGQQAQAVKMIAGLSQFLRRVTDANDEALSTLSEELALTRKYLELQEMRYAHRLCCEIDIPEELRAHLVPTMILQPLVENAIEHGIEKRSLGGKVLIRARIDSNLLVLAITNDGPHVGRITEGVGISNTRARLKNIYGDNAKFTIEGNSAGTVDVRVQVPVQV